jgi:hypothetical protein
MPTHHKRARGGGSDGGPAATKADDVVTLLSSSDDDEGMPPRAAAAAAPKTKGASGSGRGSRSGGAAAKSGDAGKSLNSTGGGGGGRQTKLAFKPQPRSLADLLAPSLSQQQPGSAPLSQAANALELAAPSVTAHPAATASGATEQQQQQQPLQPQIQQQELWVDSHEPATPDELAVHPKKVAEVRTWLEHCAETRARRAAGVGYPRPLVLVVTGPPGCGKSTAVRVLARALGFDVAEWAPPVPTLWSESQYLVRDV